MCPHPSECPKTDAARHFRINVPICRQRRPKIQHLYLTRVRREPVLKADIFVMALHWILTVALVSICTVAGTLAKDEYNAVACLMNDVPDRESLHSGFPA